MRFDYVLVATGRPPNLENLDLATAGLDLDDKGVPEYDRETMRCGESAIFLAGDVADDLPLLHEASHEGAIAGRNAVAWPVVIKTDRFTPFSLVQFVHPKRTGYSVLHSTSQTFYHVLPTAALRTFGAGQYSDKVAVGL